MESLGYFLVGLVFLSFGVLYFLYLTKPKEKLQKISRMNPELVISKWSQINEMLGQGGPSNFKQAIIEGDKLVDYVLKSKVPGETMGERLKAGKKLFNQKTYDDLWKAHKIRNQVVHESETETLSFDAKTAVKYFEKALKELRVL